MRFFSLTLCLLLTCACADSGDAQPDKAPFAKDQGRWVLVNYWAQWCKPCIEEIPELNAVQSGHEGVVVYGVNYDGATGQALTDQEAQLGIAFPTLSEDPAFSLGIRRPAVLPTTLVIDPEGKLVKTLIGPQTEDTLLAALQ